MPAANGYMRSEGSFVFAIKPLAAAERDGDPIYAPIEATAVNAVGTADGTTGLAPGRFISAPTRHAQIQLMREASARAGRTPPDFDCIEAHATGTAVGDPIEGNAIVEAYGGFEREVPLRVSSVKSNDGHMEAAAFYCALLKVILMMQRRTFAPTSKSFQVPNPEIDFDSCPMQVQTECAQPFPDHPVVIGINSFGVRRRQRALRGARVPACAAPALVDAAGASGRLHDSLVGAHIQGTGRERAPIAEPARGAAGGPLRACRQSQPPPHPFRRADGVCRAQRSRPNRRFGCLHGRRSPHRPGGGG